MTPEAKKLISQHPKLIREIIELFVFKYDDKNVFKDSFWHNFVKKITKQNKNPLFTTEDGKDIYEDDLFYWVSNQWIVKHSKAIEGITNSYNEEVGIKTFSTKEKASEYIFDNKPIFSLKEATQFFENNREIDRIEKYIQLAKSKLKQ